MLNLKRAGAVLGILACAALCLTMLMGTAPTTNSRWGDSDIWRIVYVTPALVADGADSCTVTLSQADFDADGDFVFSLGFRGYTGSTQTEGTLDSAAVAVLVSINGVEWDTISTGFDTLVVATRSATAAPEYTVPYYARYLMLWTAACKDTGQIELEALGGHRDRDK